MSHFTVNESGLIIAPCCGKLHSECRCWQKPLKYEPLPPSPVANVFCPTGKGGGIRPDCTAKAGGTGPKESKPVELKEAEKIIGRTGMTLLDKVGVRFSPNTDADVQRRGGAAYKKYVGAVLFAPGADKHTIVHEAGHGLDAALASPKKIRDRKFEEQVYWSEKNLAKSIAADRKANTPKTPVPSWEDKVGSWQYAYSSPAEAFAHIYSSLKGNDEKINGISIKDAMPKTYAAVEKKLRGEGLL